MKKRNGMNKPKLKDKKLSILSALFNQIKSGFKQLLPAPGKLLSQALNSIKVHRKGHRRKHQLTQETLLGCLSLGLLLIGFTSIMKRKMNGLKRDDELQHRRSPP